MQKIEGKALVNHVTRNQPLLLTRWGTSIGGASNLCHTRREEEKYLYTLIQIKLNVLSQYFTCSLWAQNKNWSNKKKTIEKSIVSCKLRVPPFLIGRTFWFKTCQITTCLSFVSVRRWCSLRYRRPYGSSRWRKDCVTSRVNGYDSDGNKARKRENSNGYFSSTAVTPITRNGFRNKEASFTPRSFQMEVQCQSW